MMAAADSPDLGALLNSDDEDGGSVAVDDKRARVGAVVADSHLTKESAKDADGDDDDDESGLTGFETMEVADAPTDAFDDDVIEDSQPPSDQPPGPSLNRGWGAHVQSRWTDTEEVLSQELR